MSDNTPIIVDLDGTLIKTDILWESLILLAKNSPLKLFFLPFWLSKGKAYLKSKIADSVTPDVSVLPYSSEISDFLKKSKTENRRIVLASASDERLVKKIASHLGLFDDAFGSTVENNLRGERKLELIKEITNENGFEYIGNEKADIPIWNASKRAYVYSSSRSLRNKVSEREKGIHFFRKPSPDIMVFFRAFRVHQWIKNILLFVPLVLAHDFSFEKIITLFVAFIAMSLCASSVYIINDILDIEADRHHRSKRKRPFAAGELSIPSGIAMSLLLLTASILLSSILSLNFLWVLLSYFLFTSIYSLILKETLLLDVIGLSALYSLRIFAGGVVASVPISQWFLAFSTFFFLDLAFLKRFIELNESKLLNRTKLKGRNYYTDDLQTIKSSGISCGYISVLVFYLYITDSSTVNELYRNKEWLWLVGPLLIYWHTRMWILAQRKGIESDPVLFTVKDLTSWIVLIGIVFVILIGAF